MRTLEDKFEATELGRLFFSALRDFSELITSWGIQVEPLSDPGINAFRSFARPKQIALSRAFIDYSKLFFSASKEGVDLRNEEQLLAYVLPRMGLTASKNTMEKVHDGDIIEIYNSGNIQIFRNLVFMQYCNYSLIDLVSFEFFDLYERSPLITSKLIEAGQKVLQTDVDSICFIGEVPVHVLRERFSAKRGEYLVTMKHLCPLYSGPQRKSALLVIQTGEHLLHRSDMPSNTLDFI